MPFEGSGKDRTSHSGSPSKPVDWAEASNLHREISMRYQLCSRKDYGSKMRDEWVKEGGKTKFRFCKLRISCKQQSWTLRHLKYEHLGPNLHTNRLKVKDWNPDNENWYYLSAQKGNELFNHEKIWRNLKYLLLSKRSLSVKATYYMIPTIWHSWKSKTMRDNKKISGCQGLGGRERWTGEAKTIFRSLKLFCGTIMVNICH